MPKINNHSYRLSYSYLKGFDTCPRQFAALRVHKTVPWPKQGTEQKTGDSVHKQIENYFLHGIETDSALARRGVNFVAGRGGLPFCELGIYLTEDNKITTATDYTKGYMNGRLDLVIMSADNTVEKALLVDWKTGKFYPDPFQLVFSAALMFLAYPWIHDIESYIYFLAPDQSEPRRFIRSELPLLLRQIEDRHGEIRRAVRNNKFEARPSGLCKAHCNVKSCEFNGRSAS